MMQHKAAAFELKKEPDQDGAFEGYASVFGVVDDGMDVVERGAFGKSLGAGRKPKMLWQHDRQKIVGVWDEVKEDERGLFVRGRLLKGVAQAEEAMVLMRAGALDSMSIGYRTVEAIPEGGGRIRKLMEVELHEISLVTFPMLSDAKVTAVKSEDGTFDIRKLEGALRDVCGLSQREAKALLADGFAGLKATRDVDVSAADDEAKALLQSLEKLKGAFHV
jgi:HK97 family phage prohead protease